MNPERSPFCYIIKHGATFSQLGYNIVTFLKIKAVSQFDIYRYGQTRYIQENGKYTYMHKRETEHQRHIGKINSTTTSFIVDNYQYYCYSMLNK